MNGSNSGNAPQQRTLLLAPPSISSHEEALRDVYTTFDRATSDLTMLDRLSAGLVALTPATYDLVVVLTSTTTERRDEVTQLLTRRVYDAVATSMKAGALLRAQGGPSLPEAEAILAGLVAKGDGTFEKTEEEAPVLLRLGGKKKNKTMTNGNGGIPIVKKAAAATISLSLEDDLDGFNDDDDDDELVDEDTLLTEEDINRTIQPRTLLSRSNKPFDHPTPHSLLPRGMQARITDMIVFVYSSRMYPQDRQAAAGLQGLYLRTSGQARGRGQDAARQG
jgi:hypothetical protein